VGTGPARHAFAARLFASPAIKSWKTGDEPALRKALAAALDEVRGGGPLVLDLLVDFEAEDIEPRLEAAKPVLWRAHRSKDLGARMRRTLGFYSGESNVAAAVEVRDAAAVNALLVGSVLWDSEFSLYPPPAKPLAELPDPHYEIPGFAIAAEWTLNQDTGTESWLVTARDAATLERVCTALKNAFDAHALPNSFADAPEGVFGKR